MKYLFQFLRLCFLSTLIISCSSSNIKKEKEKPVIISNKSLEYEIIILDIGFTLYLNTIAKPINYYSLKFLENKKYYLCNQLEYESIKPIKIQLIYI